MIVSIKNDDGVTSYDVAKIEDENVRANANVIISKGVPTRSLTRSTELY